MEVGIGTLFISNLISIGVAGLIGHYVGFRGITGVKSDLADAKLEAEKLKNKIKGK